MRRQRRIEIDGCLKRQNPAYRLTCIFRKKSGGRSFTLFLCVGHALFKWISAFSGITGPALEEQAPAGGPSRPPGTGPTPAAASSPSPPGITDRMGAPMRSCQSCPSAPPASAMAASSPAHGGSRRYISVALFLGSPPAGVTRYPCPVEPGLSSQTGLSPRPRGCPACLPDYDTGKYVRCQIFRVKWGI